MKKYIYTLLIPFMLLMLSESHGQTHIRLSGQVVTSAGEPAAFAHIYVKEKNMGGTTDPEGNFLYFISEDYLNDTVQVTLIGFETLEIPVRELTNNPDQVLTLQENVIQLENVTIYAPEKIMKEALKNVTESLDPSQYYSRKGVITLARKEDEQFSLFEEIGFNYYHRGVLEGRTLIGYEPVAQRRSIDYSDFAYVPAKGSKRTTSGSYFFGGYMMTSLQRSLMQIDSLDLDITDIVEEDGQKLYVITHIRERGGPVNYYIDVEENLLKKVEYISNASQISLFVGGSPFNSSKYNRFRYLFVQTYHLDKTDDRFLISKINHETRTQYIERLTGFIHRVYHDKVTVRFLDYTPLSEQPKKFRDEFQIPIAIKYNPGYWSGLETRFNHGISKEIITSLSSSRPLEQQFTETGGKVIREDGIPSSSFNKKDQKKQSEVNDLDLFISALKNNTYEADYPPELSWEDIPALLEIANSEIIIDRFPRNILSRLYLKDCQVGIVALWLIDSIRKNEGKKVRKAWYVSPMPLLQDAKDRETSKARGGGSEFIPANSNEKLAIAYNSFKSWWENSQSMSKSKSKRINPLHSSGLNWLWR